ncbi:MAG: glycosyltransferase family 2 protein [Acidobacteria bacterium]|nr:glycosyltransferase family 2 protein [Acidobacteriota bacterium]
MRAVFWVSALLIGYTYLGYPLWLYLRCRLRPQPITRSPFAGSLSILMVVRNEAGSLRQKLENLLALEFPSERWEIIVVSDGSSDGTAEILQSYARRAHLRIVVRSQSQGKAAGLNEALALSTSDLLVFTDARQAIEAHALARLTENFADPGVGCASGELMLGDPLLGESARGVGLYWRVEKKIREMESASGSVAGATGAFYAARRELVSAIPEETILDDVFIPMRVLEQGFRVVFDPRARAWDVPDQGRSREFARKVRTLNGNYQLVELMPSLLSAKNPIRFEFISHKLLRLIVPFALLALLIASFYLSGPLYRTAMLLQLLFYVLGLLSLLRIKMGPMARAADAVLAFLLLNTAALVAFARFISGRKAGWGEVAAKG